MNNNNDMTWETIRDAFFDNDGDKLDYFIQNCGYDVNYNEVWPGNFSNFPVLRACRVSGTNCLRVLLKHGAEINKECFVYQVSTSIFSEVVREKQCGFPCGLDMIQLLLEHGADVNCPSHKDYLFSFFKYCATQHMSHKVVQLLFLYGLKYNANFVKYTHLLTEPKTIQFYYDWPNLVTLYCLEKRNKFFLF